MIIVTITAENEADKDRLSLVLHTHMRMLGLNTAAMPADRPIVSPFDCAAELRATQVCVNIKD